MILKHRFNPFRASVYIFSSFESKIPPKSNIFTALPTKHQAKGLPRPLGRAEPTVPNLPSLALAVPKDWGSEGSEGLRHGQGDGKGGEEP